MADRIQHRRDTAERWANFNPILLEGEIGYVLDNPNQYKIGDGIHAWNDLPLRGFNGNISQETGDDQNAVMSQKAMTEKLSELGSNVGVVRHFDFDKIYTQNKIQVPIKKGRIIRISNKNIVFNGRTNISDTEFQVLSDGLVTDRDINYINNLTFLGQCTISDTISELVMSDIYPNLDEVKKYIYPYDGERTLLFEKFEVGYYKNSNYKEGDVVSEMGIEPHVGYIRYAIPLKEGEKIITYGKNGTSVRTWIFVGNDNVVKNVDNEFESNAVVTNEFTAPCDGIYYFSSVKATTPKPYVVLNVNDEGLIIRVDNLAQENKKLQDDLNNIVITSEKIKDNSVTPEKTSFFSIGKNLYNANSENVLQGYVQTGEEPRESENYTLSDYIAVKSGVTYSISCKYPANARFVAYFDNEKKYLSYTPNNNTITPEVDGYVRLSLYRQYYNQYQMEIGEIPSEYEDYRYGIASEYLPNTIGTSDSNSSNHLNIFMPKKIYVASGRTIEVYYEQILLNAHKYNISAYWEKDSEADDSIGVPLERKFQIVGGNTPGTYTLTIEVKDDSLKTLKSVSSQIVVVPSVTTGLNRILPIGSSLTNNKPWLTEIQTLTNCVMVGTRGAGIFTHEGRSGGTTYFYNDVTGSNKYTYDNNYKGAGADSEDFDASKSYSIDDFVKKDGVVYRFVNAHSGAWNDSDVYNVSQSNPFYDYKNSRFSMNYYKSLHNIEYDVIIITLGGNELTDDGSGAEGIKKLIDNIRIDDANVPIIVTQTLFKSNQNGIGRQGNTDGYVAKVDYKFHKDYQVQVLLAKTSELLEGYDNVYICPMAETHDSRYNFGNVKTPVNPRLVDIANVYELYPIDSTHPQESGYMQMADEIYSCLCYVFNN